MKRKSVDARIKFYTERLEELTSIRNEILADTKQDDMSQFALNNINFDIAVIEGYLEGKHSFQAGSWQIQ